MSRFGNCLVTQRKAWLVRSPAIVLPFILCSPLPPFWCVCVCMYVQVHLCKQAHTCRSENHSASQLFLPGVSLLLLLCARARPPGLLTSGPPLSLPFVLPYQHPDYRRARRCPALYALWGFKPHSKLFSHGGISLAPPISPRRTHD